MQGKLMAPITVLLRNKLELIHHSNAQTLELCEWLAR